MALDQLSYHINNSAVGVIQIDRDLRFMAWSPQCEEIFGWRAEEILGKRFRIKANSFFQTNSAQTENLYRTAFDMLSLGKDDRVLDLYCGTGPIGILLAERVIPWKNLINIVIVVGNVTV